MKLVIWILHLYPQAWRERYEQEMLALLEQHTVTLTTALDLLMGVLDARLDPYYRRENMLFMFRERRSILLTFLLALAVAMGTTTLWNALFFSTLNQESSLDSFFNNAMSFTGWPVLLCLGLCVPFVALSAGDEARKQRPAATRRAAWVCGGIFLGSVGWMIFSEDFVHTDEVSRFLKLILFTFILLFFASLLFLLFVAGRKALVQGMRGTLFLTLLFLAFSLVFVWKSFTAGAFTVSAFDSWMNFIGAVSPTASFSALALFLATSTLGQKSFQRVLNVGTFLLSCVTLFFLASTGWTISTWIQGGNRLHVPHTGIWLLFGGNWMVLFWLGVLAGGMALVVAITALVRGFQFQKAPSFS